MFQGSLGYRMRPCKKEKKKWLDATRHGEGGKKERKGEKKVKKDGKGNGGGGGR